MNVPVNIYYLPLKFFIIILISFYFYTNEGDGIFFRVRITVFPVTNFVPTLT